MKVLNETYLTVPHSISEQDTAKDSLETAKHELFDDMDYTWLSNSYICTVSFTSCLTVLEAQD